MFEMKHNFQYIDTLLSLQEDLNEHLKGHPPITCDICFKSYFTIPIMRAHKKRMHKDLLPLPPPPPPPPNPNLTPLEQEQKLQDEYMKAEFEKVKSKLENAFSPLDKLKIKRPIFKARPKPNIDNLVEVFSFHIHFMKKCHALKLFPFWLPLNRK